MAAPSRPAMPGPLLDIDNPTLIPAPYPTGFPRLSKAAYTGTIFACLGVAITAASLRTILRSHRYKRLDWDDHLLVFALLAYTVAVVLGFYSRHLYYFDVYLLLGMIPANRENFPYKRLFDILKLGHTSTFLLWTSIFCVKFSFLCFFKKLVSRVKYVQTWWWVVFAFLIVVGGITIPFGFYACPHFGESMIVNCKAEQLFPKKLVTIRLTASLDIISDLFLVSIPIALLWNVRIQLKTKLAVGAVFCVSIFMVIIAILRLFLSILPNGVFDTVSNSLWMTIEGAVAIVMVSIVAFRSLFGQEKSQHSGSSRSRSLRPSRDWFGRSKVERIDTSSPGTSIPNLHKQPPEMPYDPKSPRATVLGLHTMVSHGTEATCTGKDSRLRVDKEVHVEYDDGSPGQFRQDDEESKHSPEVLITPQQATSPRPW